MPDPHADPVSRLDPPETAHLLLQALLLSHARVGHLHGGGAEILDAASVGVLHGHEVLEVGLPTVVVRRRVGPSGGSPGGVGVGVRALGALPPARRAVAERIVPVVVAGPPAGRAGGSAGRERSHRAAPRGRRRERAGERAKRRSAQHRRRARGSDEIFDLEGCPVPACTTGRSGLVKKKGIQFRTQFATQRARWRGSAERS